MKKSDLKIFTNMPVLHTSRLELRAMNAYDAQDMFEYAQLEEVTKYLLWYPHPGVRETETYLRRIEKFYRKGEYYDWAVVEKKTEKMLGTCGIASFDIENNSAEIGYVINPKYQGNGYATEAVKAVLRFCFERLCLNRVCARIIDGNDASRRVAEKCGMRHEATHFEQLLIKGAYKTIHEYAILSYEFGH